jgi:hypothetical protein
MMIFRQSIATLLFTGIPICQGSLLRTRSATKQQDVKDQNYSALVNLLDETYDGSCKENATGSSISTITTLTCTQPGGDHATLMATGDTTNLIPHQLEVCSYGDNMNEQCESITFTGNPQEDLEQATKIIVGHHRSGHLRRLQKPDGTRARWKAFSDLLYQAFNGNCNGGYDSPAAVMCFHDQYTAILVPTWGGAYGFRPNILKLCFPPSFQNDDCLKYEFIDDLSYDMSQVKYLLFG